MKRICCFIAAIFYMEIIFSISVYGAVNAGTLIFVLLFSALTGSVYGLITGFFRKIK